MKVGTDGILLGAWADVSDCPYILDMGTGTGLVALMLAQRSHEHCQIEHNKRKKTLRPHHGTIVFI